MNICLDARMLNHSGIGTYIKGLLKGFAAIGFDKLTLLGDPDLFSNYTWPVLVNKSPIYSPQEQLSVAWQLRRLKPELFHAPHYNAPVFYGGKTILTIYDLIHLILPHTNRKKLTFLYAAAMFRLVTRKAKLIIAGSQNTAKDLNRLIGTPWEKIRVIYAGIDDGFKPADKPDIAGVLAKYNLPPNYILYVGNIRLSKNVKMLTETFMQIRHLLPENMKLALVGKNFMGNWINEISGAGDILYLGKISATDLPALYSGASAFVFPSLYEGFGFPPLEAMSCGCPVIASNQGSLPEVLGEAAVFFDPHDKETLGKIIVQVMGDANLRQNLIDKGLKWTKRYTWKETAKATLKAYEFCNK